MLRVGHRGTEYKAMALREFRHQVVGVRDFALIFEDVNPAASHHLVRELRLAPADLQRRDNMVEQVGRNTAGVVPVFAETEEPVRVPGPFWRRSEPRLPV